MRIVRAAGEMMRDLDTVRAALQTPAAECHHTFILHTLNTALHRTIPAIQHQALALQQDRLLNPQTGPYAEGVLEGAGRRDWAGFGRLDGVSHPLPEGGVGGETQTGSSKEIRSHLQLFLRGERSSVQEFGHVAGE